MCWGFVHFGPRWLRSCHGVSDTTEVIVDVVKLLLGHGLSTPTRPNRSFSAAFCHGLGRAVAGRGGWRRGWRGGSARGGAGPGRPGVGGGGGARSLWARRRARVGDG